VEHGRPLTQVRQAGTNAALTRRERRILTLIASGLSNVQIARDLDISVNTVKFHIRGAYRAIGARRREDAVRWAVSNGLA
jgi:two-component system, NarL family, response regulator LiaR